MLLVNGLQGSHELGAVNLHGLGVLIHRIKTIDKATPHALVVVVVLVVVMSSVSSCDDSISDSSGSSTSRHRVCNCALKWASRPPLRMLLMFSVYKQLKLSLYSASSFCIVCMKRRVVGSSSIGIPTLLLLLILLKGVFFTMNCNSNTLCFSSLDIHT